MRVVFVGATLCLAIATLSGCRSDKPPIISIICITDGAGGMDCSLSDGTTRYLPPSQSGNMWCTTQDDMARFASWCYKTDVNNASNKLESIEQEVRR